MFDSALGKRVNLVPPVDLNGGVTSPEVSMKGHRLAEIIIQLGVSSGAVPTVTVEECQDASGTGNTAIAFECQKCETAYDAASGDVFGVRTAVSASGLALSTTNNVFYRLFVRADQLSDGSPYFRIVFSNPSASVIGSALVILHEPRHAKECEATVLA